MWSLLGTAAALGGSCATLIVLAVVRADSFGLSTDLLLFQLGIAACFANAVAPGIALATWSRLSTLPAIWVLAVLLPVTGVELWFSADETAFRAEVAQRGEAFYERSRWSPFEHHGLGYSQGDFYAHD